MEMTAKGGQRAKNAAATKQAMLEAARRRFLQESYENVGLRDIAGDVGVDVALVSRYFGSKEDLFRDVLRGDHGKKMAVEGEAGDLPARLACMALQPDQDRAGNVERLLIILRSSSSPRAAEIVREALNEDMLEPLADMLDGPDASVRASLALALLMGTKILRTVMTLEPLCGADGCTGAKLMRLLEAALAGEESPNLPDRGAAMGTA